MLCSSSAPEHPVLNLQLTKTKDFVVTTTVIYFLNQNFKLISIDKQLQKGNMNHKI